MKGQEDSQNKKDTKPRLSWCNKNTLMKNAKTRHMWREQERMQHLETKSWASEGIIRQRLGGLTGLQFIEFFFYNSRRHPEAKLDLAKCHWESVERIENWGIGAHGRSPSDLPKLELFSKEEWATISASRCANLIEKNRDRELWFLKGHILPVFELSLLQHTELKWSG